jgi:hypothetical protein
MNINAYFESAATATSANLPDIDWKAIETDFEDLLLDSDELIALSRDGLIDLSDPESLIAVLGDEALDAIKILYNAEHAKNALAELGEGDDPVAFSTNKARELLSAISGDDAKKAALTALIALAAAGDTTELGFEPEEEDTAVAEETQALPA